MAAQAVSGRRRPPNMRTSKASSRNWRETLDAIDFHKGRAPESAMRKLRRLFLRADLDAREVRLLRGILADAQRMARLAAEPAATSQSDASGPLSDGPQIG